MTAALTGLDSPRILFYMTAVAVEADALAPWEEQARARCAALGRDPEELLGLDAATRELGGKHARTVSVYRTQYRAGGRFPHAPFPEPDRVRVERENATRRETHPEWARWRLHAWDLSRPGRTGRPRGPARTHPDGARVLDAETGLTGTVTGWTRGLAGGSYGVRWDATGRAGIVAATRLRAA